MALHEYIWLVPLFPALCALVNGLAGARLPRLVVGVSASCAVAASAVMSTLIFFEVVSLPPVQRILADVVICRWLDAGSLQIDVGFLIDPLSILMMLVVTWVGLLVHVYSLSYMRHGPCYNRYFCELNLFVFFMLVLITANNFVMLFFGWEGVGLCSYLLIGFWFEKNSASNAGRKAFVMNRIGDFGFLTGMLIIYFTFGKFGFQEIFSAAPSSLVYGGSAVTAITICLFLGAIGKSAQIPLYTWLPDAMEGPSPVSALIHAATMVTAGVYMIVRCNVLYLMAPVSLLVVAIVGACTALFAATIALTQFDIKRVLAFSTISHLGFMFMACGCGAFTVGVFHLMTHAFFKSLLFLCAGNIMHALNGELDMRRMGGLGSIMPATCIVFIIGTLSLAGIPPFAGFFSKDEILYSVFSSTHSLWPSSGTVLWFIGFITAMLSALYMFRAMFMIFFGKDRTVNKAALCLNERSACVWAPLWLLAAASIAGGWVGAPWFPALNFFSHWLAPVTEQGRLLIASQGSREAVSSIHHSILFEHIFAAGSVLVALAGIGMAWFFYIRRPDLPDRCTRFLGPVYFLMRDRYRVDELYRFMVVHPLALFSKKVLWKVCDDILIDGAVNGVARLALRCGVLARRMQTGLMQHYALAMLAGMTLLIIYFMAFT